MKRLSFALVALLLVGCSRIGPVTGKVYAWDDYRYNFEVMEHEENLWRAKLDAMAQRVEQKSQVRREVYVAEHPGLDEQTQNAIVAGKVRMGMTQNQVYASWGGPHSINESVNARGTREQWVYPHNYLYFKNGRLESWQTSR